MLEYKNCTAVDWENNTRSLNWDRVKVHEKGMKVIEGLVSPPGKLLEIGAQAGLDAEHLSKKGYDVTALDFNAEAIGLLSRKRNIFHCVQGDGLSLPFREEIFDLVYSQGLIEHFIDPELSLLLREQMRIVKKGGYILIDVPNTWSLNTPAKKFLLAAGKWIVPWEKEYTIKQLQALGEKQGLSTIRTYSWGYDKYIGERVRKLVRHIIGYDHLDKIEELYGPYFQKCIGAVLQKM